MIQRTDTSSVTTPLTFQFYCGYRHCTLSILTGVLVSVLPLLSHAACGVAGGSSPCVGVRDVAMVHDNSGPATHTSNPVNVITGNKYRQVIDFTDSSNLKLIRHYNSRNAAYNQGLGLGWHMSYLAYIDSMTKETLSIVQSDGRRIVFLRQKNQPVFHAAAAEDGYIRQTGEQFRWQHPQGKTLWFRGPFLHRVIFADRSELRLGYDNRGLKSVQDEAGRRIEFHYGSEEQNTTLLSRIVLPDNSYLEYRYREKRLSEVLHNGELQQTYHYEDPHNTGLLTGVTDRFGTRLNQIEYDTKGEPVRVVNHESGHSVRFEYHEAIDGSGVTRARASNGATGVWNWKRHTKHQRYQLTQRTIKTCEDCPAINQIFHYDQHHRLITNNKITLESSSRVTAAEIKQSSGTLDSRHSTMVAQKNPQQQFPKLTFGPLGNIESVNTGINQLSFSTHPQARRTFKNPRNARAAARVIERLDKTRTKATSHNCSVTAPAESSLINEIDQTINQTDDEHCDITANPPESSTAVMPGAVFRDVRADDCSSYFDNSDNTGRGFQIEDALASHADFANAQITPTRFPIVDFIFDQTAFAIKSHDLRSPSYLSTDSVYRRLMSDAADMEDKFLGPIRELGQVQTIEGGLTTTITDADFDLLIFELVIKQGTATPEQQAQITRAAQEMLDLYGIVLVVIEIP